MGGGLSLNSGASSCLVARISGDFSVFRGRSFLSCLDSEELGLANKQKCKQIQTLCREFLLFRLVDGRLRRRSQLDNLGSVSPRTCQMTIIPITPSTLSSTSSKSDFSEARLRYSERLYWSPVNYYFSDWRTIWLCDIGLW